MLKNDRPFAALMGFTIILVVVIGFMTNLSSTRDKKLREQTVELRTTVKQTNIELGWYSVRLEQALHRTAALRGEIIKLEGEANVARSSTLEALVLRETARSSIQEDTLAPALRNLLLAERTVAVTYKRELRIANARIVRLDSIITIETNRADDAVSLLWGVRAERDTAMDIISSYEKRWDFSLSRLLFRDLPRKAACAAGGAAVAAMNDGDVMIGAGVSLLACLLVESML